MPDTLKTNYVRKVPNFAQTPTRDLVISNGFDRVQRWNGLATGTVNLGFTPPSAAPVANTAGGTSGTITGLYYVGYRFVNSQGTPSSLSPLATASFTSMNTIIISSVAVSVESDVASRQIFRSLADDSTVVYLDQTISNNTGTTATSTRTDDDLLARQALRIVNQDGSVNAYRFEPPPQNQAVFQHHQDRLFCAVTPDYEDGHIELTSGSTTVVGIATQFTTQMVDRQLWVAGAAYTISRYVNSTSIRIAQGYGATSDKFVEYAIRPERSEQGAIYWSVLSEPESWPYAPLVAMEDGDDISALIPLDSFLFVAKQRHLYRFVYQQNPLYGGLYLQTDRGCINHRCWTRVNNDSYMIDREGVHLYSGGASSDISADIQDFFRPGTDNSIQWEASEHFHAEYYQAEQTVRFFVSIGSNRFPKHALCYHHIRRTWHLEEYPWPITSTTLAMISGMLRMVAGTASGKVMLLQEGSLDGTKGYRRPRGTVSSSTSLSLTDTTASYPSDAVGSVVAIVEGTGKGQVRAIVAATATKLSIDAPWMENPDSTSVYQIGAIGWKIRTGRYRLASGDTLSNREIALCFDPTSDAQLANVRLYLNHDKRPTPPKSDTELVQGVRPIIGGDDVEMRLDSTEGYLWYDWASLKPTNTRADQFVSVEMTGLQGKDRVKFSAIDIEGAR